MGDLLSNFFFKYVQRNLLAPSGKMKLENKASEFLCFDNGDFPLCVCISLIYNLFSDITDSNRY